MSKFGVQMNIRGRDGASGTFARVGRSLRRNIGGAMRSVGGAVRSVTAAIGRVPVVGAMLGGLGVAAAVSGIARLTTGYAEQADAIAKLARYTGIGAAALQEYRYAAGQAGVDGDLFDASIRKFTMSLSEFQTQGSGTLKNLTLMQPALARLLKSATSTEDAFEMMVRSMGLVERESERTRLAQLAFGEEGARMALLAGLGAAEIGKLRESFRRLGGGIRTSALGQAEEFSDELVNLKLALGGVRNALGEELVASLLPRMKELTEWLVDNRSQVVEWARDFAKAFGSALESMVKAIPDVIAGIESIVGGIRDAIEFMKELGAGVSAVVKPLSLRDIGDAAGRGDVRSSLTVRGAAANVARDATTSFAAGPDVFGPLGIVQRAVRGAGESGQAQLEQFAATLARAIAQPLAGSRRVSVEVTGPPGTRAVVQGQGADLDVRRGQNRQDGL